MNIEKQYNEWLLCPDVPEELKLKLKSMTSAEVTDAFFKEISFGTAGMRGIIGPGPNCMNIITVERATIGYASALYKINPEKRQTVVIAHDNRHLSKEFTQVVANTLAKCGIDVKLFDALRPTPLLSYAIRYFRAQGGIMITASHNPKDYNGYKVYDRNGCQLTTQDSALVTREINKNPILPPFYYPEVDRKGIIEIVDHEVDESFLKECKSVLLNTDDEKVLKIVFTPQHGTAAVLGVRILEELGYKVFPVIEQMNPDPHFTNTKTPNPEKPEAYEKAIELAKKVDADILICTDPDADRVGFGYKSSQGEFVLQSGNQTGAALVEYVMSTRKKLGLIPPHAFLLQSIVTSTLGSRIAKEYGVDTLKYLTGFKYIGSAIAELESKDPKAFQMGYEESYGYIFKTFCRDKDSIEALAMIAEMVNHYLLQGIRFDKVMEMIYQKYGYTLNKNIEYSFSASEGADAGKKLDILREKNLNYIGDTKVLKIEDYLNQITYNPDSPKNYKIIDSLPKENVLKYYLDNDCWIAIRPSGTEPKIKFYFECRGNDREHVDSLPEKYHQFISSLI